MFDPVILTTLVAVAETPGFMPARARLGLSQHTSTHTSTLEQAATAPWRIAYRSPSITHTHTHTRDSLEGIGRNAERRHQESAGAVAPRQAASSCCSSKSRSGRMIASSET